MSSPARIGCLSHAYDHDDHGDHDDHDYDDDNDSGTSKVETS